METLNIKYEEQSTLLKQTQALKTNLQQDLEKINSMVDLKNQTIDFLQSKVNQLVADFKLKTQELDSKLQTEDIRY